MRGNITRRGKHSWRLKFDAGRHPDGSRKIRFVTVRGTRREAEVELVRLLGAIDNGTAVDPAKTTVADYLRSWLDGADHLAGKTRERYRELVEQQVVPHLGGVVLQKLRPAQVAGWHAALLKGGGRDGRALSARTVGHAHRVLHAALGHAARLEIVARNVCSMVKPPKVEAAEVEILTEAQVSDALARLTGHDLHPIVCLALGTGMRRGEICGLQWGDVDLDAPAVRVERSMEQTDAGLRIKAPKSRHGRRLVSLPASVVEALRAHRVQQLEQRLALGLGRPGTDDLVFTMPDGSARSPDNLSSDWRRAVRSLGLPAVTFHALRHSHASALIAAGLDVLTISRRLGHGTAAFTLATYTHKFADKADMAARAMDAVMGGGATK